MPGAKPAGKEEIPLSQIEIEVVGRIDALFVIERSINGKNVEERHRVRQIVIARLGGTPNDTS